LKDLILSILDKKNTAAPSVFLPAALLREARRQKNLPAVNVPAVCILDPDGDMIRRLRKSGEARLFKPWACYHTQLDTLTLAGQTVGIVGCAVGAPFAVLVAEQLFASGCRLLLSVTSAGQITPSAAPPYFVIIALYAFASSAKVQVLCLAHVTNTMGQAGDDFEKGEADGTRDALTVLENLVSVFQT